MQNDKTRKKVGFLDARVIQSFSKIVAMLATAATLFSIFVSVPDGYKIPAGICFLIVLFVIYVYIWNCANKIEEARFKINGTDVHVVVGDLFAQKGWKVIGVNDFFDTIADDIIIAKKTLHGKFLDKFADRIQEINDKIEHDEELKKAIVEDQVPRLPGKPTRYKLGTVFLFEEYICAAFGRVEEAHQVYLDAGSYVMFWMNFWKNVDRIYAGKSISIPLMGAGITRFRNERLSKQQLLEVMLWTMKVSGFQCTYPGVRVNFIIHEGDKDEINFFELEKAWGIKA